MCIYIVLLVATLDLGKDLRVEVVVPEIYLACRHDPSAALPPSWKRRNKLIGRCQLNINVKRNLEFRYSLEYALGLGIQFNIDVDSLVTNP